MRMKGYIEMLYGCDPSARASKQGIAPPFVPVSAARLRIA